MEENKNPETNQPESVVGDQASGQANTPEAAAERQSINEEVQAVGQEQAPLQQEALQPEAAPQEAVEEQAGATEMQAQQPVAAEQAVEQAAMQPVAQDPTVDVGLPPKMSFLGLITRTFAGFGGGLAGTIILLIIYLLSASVIAPVLAPTEEAAATSPLFTFVLMGMVFASVLAANLLSPFFISFTQKERYRNVTTALFQIFIANIVIFIILIPLYFISSGTGLESISFAAGLQVSFSVLATALIFEIISSEKHALLGVYSSIFAVLSGLAFNIIIFQATQNATILLFVALPILWGGVGFVHAILVMLYHWAYSVWGVDFLSTTQKYSKDYGEAAPEEEMMVDIEPPKDTEGIEFFNKEDSENQPPQE